MKFLLLLLFAIPALAQTDLPERGTVSDLKNKSKIYIVADGDHFKAITKAVNKQFVPVGNAQEAEFFLEYKTLSRQPFGILLGATTETGQLDAYIYRDKRKIIAWTDSLIGGGFKGDAANRLAKRFIKAWKKLTP